MTLLTEQHTRQEISSLDVLPVDGVDLLARFEAVRSRECRFDHPSFHPAEVTIPTTHMEDSLRMVAYVENAEQAVSQEGRPTFRSGRFWATRGFVGWHPHYGNAISTGTYWAGAVILQVEAYGSFRAFVEWTTQKTEIPDYFWDIKLFLEGVGSL